jgi:hypothetical protein
MDVLDSLDLHCEIVVRSLGIESDSLIPFLGAGANLAGRPEGAHWDVEGYLPSGSELASYLAKPYGFPDADLDLLRVSQWVDLVSSPLRLANELHHVFSRPYHPNALHRFLAGLPQTLRNRGCAAHGQLLLTTNYDDMLEQAFAEAAEPVDVVAFEVAHGEHRFVHIRPDGERIPIDDPGTYRTFALEERSVILKIHGNVDRHDQRHDTYVITEDHYIDYMATQCAGLIPAYLMRRIRESDLLFLGYSMRDWNLRVILQQIWSEQGVRSGGWSIQRSPSEVDRQFWARHGIHLLDADLGDWVDAMRRQLT